MAKQRIVPHLWFDKEAKEAARFYASVFPNSRITHTATLHDTPTPSGDCDIVSFEVVGHPFMAINAGPLFRLNPSVSFTVSGNTTKDVDDLWARLSDGGQALMPLDAYFFSPRYGWIQDRYGVSWQLILQTQQGERRPLVPSLMFVGANCGKAEQAIGLYTSVFRDAKVGRMARYGADQAPDREGTLMYADFMIEGQWFAAMDSAHAHHFNFNEAISFVVRCDSQEEIDYFSAKLSAVPEAEQCGWLKDRYGLSWQIVPVVMDDMMRRGTPEQIARVTQAFLKMKKFDLAALKRAYQER